MSDAFDRWIEWADIHWVSEPAFRLILCQRDVFGEKDRTERS
jgi:hypothetical protein